MNAISIHFDPLAPLSWMMGIGALAAVLFLASLFLKNRGWLPRLLCVAAFILALLNPSLLREERKAARDTAVIVLDKSRSQEFGTRGETGKQALEYLKNELAKFAGLDLRIIEAGQDNPDETRIFEQLDRTLADVPRQRRAGVFFITDGQIHDIPQTGQYGPVHALLTGVKNERDRRLVITQAPAYGIVGQSVTLRYKIEDTGISNSAPAVVTLNTYDGAPQIFEVYPGQEESIELQVSHAGQNVFELEARNAGGEITQANNKSALVVNGVRDRLRVLLVSGQPHAGGRTWRDLLTSDPGVDLVHFTILREPDKLDATPQNELALIAFPFQELFEIKLYEFDLIIFDRYRLNRILPQNYFDNIVKYVREGGALLISSGPSFATNDSIYFTSLADILPAAPTDEVIKKPFLPRLSDAGRHHPVTRDLHWKADENGNPAWGPWLRQVSLNPQSGDTLMKGAEDKPLLVLDRVGEGRVAQIASDHIWLWSRGYEGGGPHTELLRRIVHWLMKEPELDEKALNIKVSGDDITLESRDYRQKEITLEVTKPDGSKESLTLESSADGLLQKNFKADQRGIYSFTEKDGRRQFAVVGEMNPPELQGVKTTPDPLQPLMQSSGGGAVWLSETPRPFIRMLPGDRRFAGNGWLGLRENNDYTVTGVRDTPLLPAGIAALLLIAAAFLTWWREGRGRI